MMDAAMMDAVHKRFVQYGAGNIGRGFIGQLFSEAGYEVIFIDVDPVVVDALNRERRYPVRVVSREGQSDSWVEPVSAVDGRDAAAVTAAIAGADMMATAIGANVLPRIAGLIAQGLEQRWLSGDLRPLDILVCENLMEAGTKLEAWIREALPPEHHGLFAGKVGLVEASIGRMVPVPTLEQKTENPLLVRVEPYKTLPVDRAAFRGSLPSLQTLEPYAPFRVYLERKLYLHNMGHAMAAYLGDLHGCKYIHEAIERPDVRIFVQSAMTLCARALSLRHGMPLEQLLKHVDDLLYRFGNPALGDTVQRVGGDPIRKIAPDDRLTGAARMCLSQGLFPGALVFGLAAALRFQADGDRAAGLLHEEITRDGLEQVLLNRCGIRLDEPLGQAVSTAVSLISEECPPEEWIACMESWNTNK